jgi:hypothetical protein
LLYLRLVLAAGVVLDTPDYRGVIQPVNYRGSVRIVKIA